MVGVLRAPCPDCGKMVDYLLDRGEQLLGPVAIETDMTGEAEAEPVYVGGNVAAYSEDERLDRLGSDRGPATPDNQRYADYDGQQSRFGRTSLSIWNPPK